MLYFYLAGFFNCFLLAFLFSLFYCCFFSLSFSLSLLFSTSPASPSSCSLSSSPFSPSLLPPPPSRILDFLLLPSFFGFRVRFSNSFTIWLQSVNSYYRFLPDRRVVVNLIYAGTFLVPFLKNCLTPISQGLHLEFLNRIAYNNMTAVNCSSDDASSFFSKMHLSEKLICFTFGFFNCWLSLLNH